MVSSWSIFQESTYRNAKPSIIQTHELLYKNSNFISQVEKVETNILIFQIEKSIDTDNFLNKMSNQNIKLISMGDNKLRLVTHKDYTNQMHEKFLEIISKLKFWLT